jgi:hypothetical protein
VQPDEEFKLIMDATQLRQVVKRLGSSRNRRSRTVDIRAQFSFRFGAGNNGTIIVLTELSPKLVPVNILKQIASMSSSPLNSRT